MAGFDFSTITVEEAELPEERQRGRKSTVDLTPFLEPLAASFESGKGRKMVVPAKAVKDATYGLRRAADDLNIGVRIVYLDGRGKEIRQEVVKIKNDKGEEVDKTITAVQKASEKSGNVQILFEGRKRKQQRKSAESGSEGQTEEAEGEGTEAPVEEPQTDAQESTEPIPA